MAFKTFECTTLKLSIFMLSSLSVSTSYAVSPENLIAPASAEACVALESNADRLSCYDTLFKVPEAEKTTLLSERQVAKELAPEPTQPETLK